MIKIKKGKKTTNNPNLNTTVFMLTKFLSSLSEHFMEIKYQKFIQIDAGVSVTLTPCIYIT